MAKPSFNVLETLDVKNLPSPNQVRKVFGADVVDLLIFAGALGWKVLFNNTGTSITLSAFNERDKIHLSSRNKGRHSLSRFYKRVIKNADPDKAENVMDMLEGNYDPELVDAALKTLGIIGLSEGEVMAPEPEPKPVKKTVAVKKAEAKVKAERRIISERPALMHRGLNHGKGKSYPSKTTIERRWSDGSVDYACAVDTCDETSLNRRHFGGPHWAMHIRKGEAEPVNAHTPVTVDDPTYTESAYTKKDPGTRRASLVHFLSGVDLKTTTTEELADLLLEWLGDMSHRGPLGPVEPLTDAQVIERIRTLIDRGHYADQEQQIVERDLRIDALLIKEAELEVQCLDTEQRAVKAEQTLRALSELAVEGLDGEDR